MIIHSQNGCRRHNPEVNHSKKDSCYSQYLGLKFISGFELPLKDQKRDIIKEIISGH